MLAPQLTEGLGEKLADLLAGINVDWSKVKDWSPGGQAMAIIDEAIGGSLSDEDRAAIAEVLPELATRSILSGPANDLNVGGELFLEGDADGDGEDDAPDDPTEEELAQEAADEQAILGTRLDPAVVDIMQKAGLRGVDPADVNFEEIYNILAAEARGQGVSPSMLDVDIPEGVSDAERQLVFGEKIKSLAYMGAVNETLLVSSFESWGRGKGWYQNPKDAEVERIVAQTDLSYAQASRVVDAANSSDVNVDLLARVTAYAKQTGHSKFNIVPRHGRLTIGSPGHRSDVYGEYSDPDADKFPNLWVDMAEVSANQLAADLQGAMGAFGSEAVAIVSLFNEELAGRMVNDPWGLGIGEWEDVLEMLGPDAADNPRLSAEVGWIQTRIAGGFANQTQTVDTGTVREAARSLADAWNLPGVDDAFLDTLAGRFAAQYSVSMQDVYGNPFADGDLPRPQHLVKQVKGAGASAAEAIRGTAQYAELFGNKADGESEEEYVARMQSEANQEFGASFDSTEAVRAGQRSGNAQDVRGYGIASGEAFDSETFQDRLARFGQAFKAVT